MKYFYAPFIQDPDSGQYLPAKTFSVEGGTDRYVLAAPDSMVGPEGWAEKNRGEVNADYPGLIPAGG